MGRPVVLLNGAVALWITGVIVAQVAGLLPPIASGILIGIVLLPYIALLATRVGPVGNVVVVEGRDGDRRCRLVRNRGLSWPGGAALIAGYIAFMLVILGF